MKIGEIGEKTLKAGGFKDGYFISHKPECRSMADHILMFEAGKNPAWE
jgi:hypothetical protein